MAQVDSTLGAIFVGLLLAVFLQGVLTVQAYYYYETYPSDRRTLKFMVAVVWLLDFSHLVLIVHATYFYLITSWGSEVSELRPTLVFDLNCAINGIATFTCQSFFIYRVWVLSSKNIPLVGSLVIGSFATLGLEIFMSERLSVVRSLTLLGSFAPESASLFSINTAVDLAIAGILCSYLRRERNGFPGSESLIARVTQIVVATSAVTSVFAAVSLISYIAGHNKFIFLATHFSLGRIYTNALLANLNFRQHLRTADNTIGLDYAVSKTRKSIGFGSKTTNGFKVDIESGVFQKYRDTGSTITTSMVSYPPPVALIE